MASKSRRKQKAADCDESMDVDRGGLLSEKHQLILQYLMHAHMTKKMEIVQVHKKLFNDSESLDDTLSAITNKINALKMDIKRVMCDITGETYFVLIHTTGESFFPRCCIFSKSQLEFLKQVLTGIVLSADGNIGRIQALNSCKTLSKSEADEAISLFVKEKILIEMNSWGLCLSPLAVVEFEPFFNACLADNMLNCDLCKQLVFVGKVCHGCSQRFHFHCVSKWMRGNRTECPKCMQVWTVDMDADTE